MNSQGLKYTLIILIPLVLSAYTHVWNLLGFPSFHIDEAHYMRRVMLVLAGMGPQESAANGYPRTYDHPYFGQLFLAGILSLAGYPDPLIQDQTVLNRNVTSYSKISSWFLSNSRHFYIIQDC